MPTVSVSLSHASYSVMVESGCLDQAGDLIQKTTKLRGQIAIISDSTVAGYYSNRLITSIKAVGYRSTLHIIPAGEASKSLSHAETLCREMIVSGHDRSSFVIALGGGVVGDLAGFVASIFYRGIPFVQIPTTIVSLVDSAVGGKTGVNTPEGKNLLGAFHQPKLVLADPETLETLEPREFREGFAEAIKHAAIRDAEMLDLLEQLDPMNQRVSADLIARNIAIKARVVEEDEKELSGTRALLNFGHTIGHGIEASVPYGSLLHGEAISLGMRAALFLSEKIAGLSSSESNRILKVLELYHLPLQLDSKIRTETVLEKMKTDKKFSGGQIKFVLLKKLGEAFVSENVTSADIIEAIEYLYTPPQ